MFIPKHILDSRPDEIITRVIHRHWFNLLSHFVVLFLILLLLIASIFGFSLFSSFTTIILNPSLLFFFQSFILLFLWVYVFLIWIDYYFDVWIITNERIVNIEQKGLFKRVISELDAARIQDVTSDIQGLFPTFFDFGQVYVQTAGEQTRFQFRNIPCPNRCKDEIMHLAKTAQQNNQRETV